MFDPLIKTPPPPHTHSDTHNMTLHTGLMLTIWISTNARSKSNSQWLTPPSSILPVGILYLLPYMTSTNQFRKVALTHVPLIVVLKLLQLFVETMMTIYIYGRHWIPHHNKPSDNDCELSLYMWYTKEHSMNEDQTWLHFMKMLCMALQKYRVETRLRSLLSFVCSG